MRKPIINKSQHSLNSDIKQMKDMFNKIRIIKEQNDPKYQANAATDQLTNGNSKEYDVAGEKLVIQGNTGVDNKLDDTLRNTFQACVEEFRQQVVDLVKFNNLEVHPGGIKWSGQVEKFNLEFEYLVGDKNGAYLKGDQIKIDGEEFVNFITQLVKYYAIFAQKWSPVITDRNQNKM